MLTPNHEARHAPWECCSSEHVSRRSLLKLAGASGLAWLTPVAELLAQQPANLRSGRPAQSVILLWLAGGPSQLETFDPHPDRKIAGGSTAITTSARTIQLGSSLKRLADQMQDVAIVRNVVSREGDHERATYNVKTGYRPDPTLLHPSLGAVLCHQLPNGKTEIPRHVSLLPNQWYGRGGYLTEKYDAFRVDSADGRLPDMSARVSDERLQRRLRDLELVERAFAHHRLQEIERLTNHQDGIRQAVNMMGSEQLDAFDIAHETKATLADFGDSDFGRSCLMALRLIEVGARCVEVTLDGWDSHIANHDVHEALVPQLDAAFAALIKHLRDRDRLDDTLIICGGEFGRTPKINAAGGRDHWPHGFSVALAGGGICGGTTIGGTDPAGARVEPESGTPVEDIHATVLAALGIQHDRELDTPVGRPIKLSEGTPINELLASTRR